MPSLRGGSGDLRVNDCLEALGGVGLGDGKSAVLRRGNETSQTTALCSKAENRTHRSLGNEVNNGPQLAGVSINERLEEDVLILVADLEDVGQDGGTVLENNVLELGSDLVLLSVEGLLSGGDSVGDGDGGDGVGDLGGLDEGVTKSDDLVILEGDVGDGVREVDAFLLGERCVISNHERCSWELRRDGDLRASAGRRRRWSHPRCSRA